MTRLFLGSLLSGVLMFLYGFVSFAVLKWHHPKPLADDTVLARAMKSSVSEHGVYMVPSQVKADGTHRNQDEWMAASAQGPYMLAVIRPGSSRRPMVSYMAASLVLNVGLAFLLGLILRRTGLPRGELIGLGALIGLFAALANWLPASNWYEYPLRYWAPYVVDQTIQGALVATVMGKFLGRPQPVSAASAGD